MRTNTPDFKHMPSFKDINRTTVSSGHTEVNETDHTSDFIHGCVSYNITFLAEISSMAGKVVQGDA